MLGLSSQYAGYRWYDHALQKKEQKIKKEERLCIKRHVSFCSRQFLLEFRRFEVSKRSDIPLLFLYRNNAGRWMKAEKKFYLNNNLRGHIHSLPRWKKKHKDEEKVRYARLLLTLRLTNKLFWFC